MVLGIFAFLSALLCFCYTLRATKSAKLFSPASLFFGLWTLILGLSLLHLYHLEPPSSAAYGLLLAMNLSFFAGNLIARKLPFRTSRRPPSHTRTKWLVFYFLCALVILFNFIDLILVIINLENGTPMWQIRNWTLAPYGSNNPILARRSFLEELIRTLICSPMTLILPGVASYFWFHRKHSPRRLFLMILAILTLCLNAIAGGGGRLGFLFLILCMFCSYYLMHRSTAARKIPKPTIILLVSTLGLMILATTFRTGFGNLFKQFYTYFAMPPTLLSIWLPTLASTSHTFGLLTLFGVFSYPLRLLNLLGLSAFVPPVFDTAMTTMLNAEKFVPTGAGISNAFVTPVYYFFADGGIVFIILASLIFGVLVVYLARRLEHHTDLRKFLFYILIMYGILVSFMRIQTVIPNYLIGFLLVAWIFKPTPPAPDYQDILSLTTSKSLSIILPVYNAERLLTSCITQLESIQNITFEIILVNDGSTDHTLEFAQQLTQTYSNLTLINSDQNHGVSHARNLGLQAARGDYVICVDVDDQINPLMYELLLKNAVSTHADISMCNYYEVYGNTHLDSKYHYNPSILTAPNIIEKYLYDHISNNVWDKLIRRSLISDLQFSEQLSIGEDILFCLETFSHTKSLAILPGKLIGYVQHPTSAMHQISPKLTEYQALLKLIPSHLHAQLQSNHLESFTFFELEMTVRGIHAISLATNHQNFAQSLNLLSNFYDSATLTKIIQNPHFSKFIRLEMLILRTFGPKAHLRLTPFYRLIKQALRS